jgi:ribonuclease Z
VSQRELVVLGTSSQVPTRTRSHNGYLLRWDGHGVLFDPGEGTQRQLLLAGVAPSQINAICITHAHGDHCLGLPGVLQRLSLDGVRHGVHLVYPAQAQDYVDRLRRASAYDDRLEVHLHPVGSDGPVLRLGETLLEAASLEHRIPTVGYRLTESPGRRMLAGRLAEAGVAGSDVGRLIREGWLERDGRTVRLAEVSAERPGQGFAFVMDTAECDGARRLARGVDMLVCEATFADREAELAAAHGHLTARQAGRLARGAGVRLLVLAHFSQRYADLSPLLEQAGEEFGAAVLARDLDTIPVPARMAGGVDG